MKVKEFIRQDKFAQQLGIELIEAKNGNATAKMEIKNEHLNAVGLAHGGAIFTLADLTLAAAANSHGNVAVAVSDNIFFTKSAGKGVLFAKAKETSINNKLATYSISITNENDELIAEFQGMVYRKKETLDDFSIQ